MRQLLKQKLLKMKINYNEYDDEMNPFHPCVACGAHEFEMDQATGFYRCKACGEILTTQDNSKKVRKKKVVKRFRDGDDEVY